MAMMIVLRVHGIAPAAAYLVFTVVALVAVSALWYTFGNITRPPGPLMTKREFAILRPLAVITAVIVAVNVYQVAILFSASGIYGHQR
jgi:hypothetical protein